MPKRAVVHFRLEMTEGQLAPLRVYLNLNRIAHRIRCDHCGEYGHVIWDCKLKRLADREIENERLRREADVAQQKREICVLCSECGFEWPEYMVKRGGVICCGKPVMITPHI